MAFIMRDNTRCAPHSEYLNQKLDRDALNVCHCGKTESIHESDHRQIQLMSGYYSRAYMPELRDFDWCHFEAPVFLDAS